VISAANKQNDEEGLFSARMVMLMTGFPTRARTPLTSDDYYSQSSDAILVAASSYCVWSSDC
jgi:hypothetical protein